MNKMMALLSMEDNDQLTNFLDGLDDIYITFIWWYAFVLRMASEINS